MSTQNVHINILSDGVKFIGCFHNANYVPDDIVMHIETKNKKYNIYFHFDYNQEEHKKGVYYFTTSPNLDEFIGYKKSIKFIETLLRKILNNQDFKIQNYSLDV